MKRDSYLEKLLPDATGMSYWLNAMKRTKAD